MVWYYAEGDRQKGPLSDEEFQELVSKGRVREETLIWKDGMENWQPLSDARQAGLVNFISSAPPRPPGDYVPAAHSGTPPVGTSTVITPPHGMDQPPGTTGTDCHQCGRGPLGVGDGVKLGNIVLCQQCDSDMERHYQQKAMRQPPPAGMATPAYGAPTVGTLTIASIFSRAVAKILDNIIGGVVIGILMVSTSDLPGVGFTYQDFVEGSEDLVQALQPWLFGSLIFSVLYDAILVGAFGATLGKMAMGIHVVSADGSRVSWNQAFVRAIAPVVLQVPATMIPGSILAMLSQFALIFGYVIAIPDRERRTLFDHLAATRVVR